jgi:hypothetical protein
MKLMAVKSVKKNVNQDVYDIKVEEDSHYILENGIVSHNSGLKYAASTIVFLSKKKDKDSEGQVIGNIIHCKLYKSRLTKENQMIDVRLNYDSGLNLYYGLLDLALKHGIFKKVSTRIELPNGDKTFEKTINEDPEKFFTPDVMAQLELAAAKEFKYGQ